MPKDSKARVKRTAHFSWSWGKKCCCCVGSARELEHGAPSTVGSSLQTLSAGAVIYCEASRLVQVEEETVCLTNVW
jgi:hypothetical protein